MFRVSPSQIYYCCDFNANDEWSPIHPTSIVRIFRFGGNAGSYYKLQLKPKTVVEFKDALQLMSVSPEKKAIDNTVKDYRKQLQACVSANGGHFEHIM